MSRPPRRFDQWLLAMIGWGLATTVSWGSTR